MGYLEAATQHLRPFFDTIAAPDGPWGRWKYHARMCRPWGLISSALVVLTQDALGLLETVPEDERRQALAFFQSTQDPADGHFKDPLVTEADHQGPHDWQDIWGQIGAAARAIRCLGGEPLHPTPKPLFTDLGATDPVVFLDALSWKNPWHVGEKAFRCVAGYVHNRPAVIRAPRQDPVLAAVFAYLETEVFDPETGYPTLQGCDKPHTAMAGAFKTVMVWMVAGETVPFAKQIIDTTLSHRRAEGNFFSDTANMCINWDAVWLLREMDLQLEGSYRHGEIADAHRGMAAYLNRVHLQSDGGYSMLHDGCTANHHSIRLSDRSYPIGDALGTRMACNCLAYADEADGCLARPIPPSVVPGETT